MAHRKDYTGERYGMLVAIKFLHREGKCKGTFWLFKCDCGGFKSADIHNTRKGHGNSCGCDLSERNITHGLSDDRIYNTYWAMMARCHRKTDKSYPRYGGKGIHVCERWQQGFSFFLEDMAEGYADDLTLERKDFRKGYSKENCVWATSIEQARNKGRSAANNSGVTGVHKNVKSDRYSYWVASWCSMDGKLRAKYFRIETLGNEEAFGLACEYRKKMIEELNKQGAGYSPSHGL